MNEENSRKLSDVSDDEVPSSPKRLLAVPSMRLWKYELSAIASDRRRDYILPLGSVEQYVKVLLAESDDATLSKDYFHEALYQTVQTWNPGWNEPDVKLEAMLSLILAFRPTVGFMKVLGFLDAQDVAFLDLPKVRNSKKEFSLYLPRGTDLYLKAFRTLAAYYPSAPYHSQDDCGFAAYTKLLKKYRKSKDYGGQAVNRLIELHALETGSDQFREYVRQNPEMVKEIILFMLSGIKPSDDVDDLSGILGNIFAALQDLALDIQEFFISPIRQLDGHIKNDEADDGNGQPIVKMANGTIIPVHLLPMYQDFYMAYVAESNVHQFPAYLRRVINDDRIN